MLQQRLLPVLQQKDSAQGLYFQQNGALAPYATLVRVSFDGKLPGRWIGRRGPWEWPPRWPNLTPPDFFLRDLLKDKIYSAQARSIAKLEEQIKDGVELCPKVCRSAPETLAKCIEHHGGHVSL